MTSKKLGMTAVVDAEERVAGIFTDGDLRRMLEKNLDVHTTPITTVMTAHCTVVAPELLAAEAVHLMQSRKINALLVANAERELLGALNMHDLLRAGVV